MQSKTILTSALLLVSLSLLWANGKENSDKDKEKNKESTPTQITWQTLSKIKMEFVGDEPDYVVKFSDEIKALGGKQVKISGFMVLTAVSEENQNFLLSQVPAGQCFFCGTGGPTSLIEVIQSKPFEPTFEMITVVGKLNLLENDPYGLFYRLTDANVTDAM